MPKYFLSIQQQLTIVDQYLQQVASSLKDKPPGFLNVQINHRYPQYYFKARKDDPRGTYIRKENLEFAAALAQKDYEERFQQAAERETYTLQRLQDQGLQRSASTLYKALSDPYEKLTNARKKLVHPYVLPDDLFVSSWLETDYERKPFYPEDPLIYTKNGQRIRSKSEKIIADTLDRLRIPYLYEFPLRLPSGMVYHPDFTLLDVRERTTVIFEHFGLMTDQSYCQTSMEKQEQYLRAGFIPGYDLLCTMEGGRHTLDQRSLTCLLSARFL